MNTLLAQPFGTLPALLAHHAATRGTHPALVLDGQVLSFAQLQACVQQVAGALQRDGVRPGQAIAICAATSLAYACTFLGAVLAGVTVVAPDSMTADGYSTSCFVLGPEVGMKFIDARPDAAALFIVREPGGGFRQIASARFAELTCTFVSSPRSTLATA